MEEDVRIVVGVVVIFLFAGIATSLPMHIYNNKVRIYIENGYEQTVAQGVSGYLWTKIKQ